MSAITLQEAQEHLRAWLDADLALATGQSYKIGTRMLTRSNAAEVRERITYWTQQVNLLSATTKQGGRVRRFVPRDT